MHYVWTVVGDDPDLNQGDRHGIDGYFMPMFDALTTKAFLRDEVRARGHAAGIYLGHNWLPGKTPAEIAATVSAEYARVQVPGLKVQFNMEEKDPERIAETLEEWRKRRPTVGTSWTMEGMQGGWMSPEFVQRVLDCRVRVVPQTFTGDMRRQESDVVVRDLLRRGFPENIISPFYDAKQLGLNWDGFAFTMGRLPYLP